MSTVGERLRKFKPKKGLYQHVRITPGLRGGAPLNFSGAALSSSVFCPDVRYRVECDRTTATSLLRSNLASQIKARKGLFLVTSERLLSDLAGEFGARTFIRRKVRNLSRRTFKESSKKTSRPRVSGGSQQLDVTLQGELISALVQVVAESLAPFVIRGEEGLSEKVCLGIVVRLLEELNARGHVVTKSERLARVADATRNLTVVAPAIRGQLRKAGAEASLHVFDEVLVELAQAVSP